MRFPFLSFDQKAVMLMIDWDPRWLKKKTHVMSRLHHYNNQTWCVLCLKRVDTGPFKGPFGLLSVKSAHIDKIRTFSQGKTNRHHALYKPYYIKPKLFCRCVEPYFFYFKSE